MSKFNQSTARVAPGKGPITASPTPTGLTHEGGPGYGHNAKSALFLLAVSNFVGEDTFYEKAGDRDNRYAQLVAGCAVDDPAWTFRFLRWLRADANMRSASIVGAAEFVRARLAAGVPSVPAYGVPAYGVPGQADDRGVERAVVDVVCQRADEPGEMLAYWMGRYGRALPKPVKRGVADAARRLYSERSLLKYDGASKGFRFADVIDLTHPTAVAPWQGALFRYALERRHNRAGSDITDLPVVAANVSLRSEADPAAWLSSSMLHAAGMTWEDALSAVGGKVDKAKLWAAMIPSMGYMALLRNLRNFDEAGVSDEVAATVAARLADPERVAKSRQFPFRFVAAYENAPSVRWSHALDKALAASLGNLPTLGGRSLILVDTSASMTSSGLSARSKMTAAKAAAVFGVALAARGEADLYGFADGTRPFQHKVPKGSSVIREVDRFLARTGEDGHGTAIAESIRRTFAGHDRVFVISDMQTFAPSWGTGNVTDAVSRVVPIYGFNLGGYANTALDAGSTNRYEFGGLTDATFRMVPLLEAGRNADWPF